SSGRSIPRSGWGATGSDTLAGGGGRRSSAALGILDGGQVGRPPARPGDVADPGAVPGPVRGGVGGPPHPPAWPAAGLVGAVRAGYRVPGRLRAPASRASSPRRAVAKRDFGPGRDMHVSL